MNCQDFELIVLRLARRQLMEAATRDRARAHAEACVRCAARLAEERALVAGIRIVSAEISKEEAPAGLEAELLRAFREHTALAPMPATDATPAETVHISRRVLAVAAVILISIAAAAIFRHISNSPEQREVMQAITPVPSATSDSPHEPITPQPNPLDDVQKLARGRRSTPNRERPTRRQPVLPDASEAEIATHFLPLSDSDDFNSLESGQVVRLELPGSALDEIGLPIDDLTSGKTVTADVLIGPDGLAHAIRFIP